MGGRGSSSGNAFSKAAAYIRKNGIPFSFAAPNAADEKAVYRAIEKYGKLTREEQAAYDAIRYDAEAKTLWNNGRLVSVAGYTAEEIKGRRKFMAHGAVKNRR